MSSLGFLSLEYIVGDQTYWLESDFEASPCLSFRVIPSSHFAGRALHGDMHIINDADYSSIKRVKEGGVEILQFKSSSKDTEITPISLDLKSFPRLSWNDAFDALVAVGVPLVDLMGFWHQNIVKGVTGAPEWVKSDLTYIVTAWLPAQKEPLFAVMGSDYKLPENPNMVTVHCDNEQAFLERLRWFRVHAISFVAKRDEYWVGVS